MRKIMRYQGAAFSLAMALGMGLPVVALTLPQAASAEALSQDTAFQTPSGARFKAPRDWTVVPLQNGFLLTPPESGNRLYVLDAPLAPSPAESVEAAFKTHQPDFARSTEITAPGTASGGWSDIVYQVYKTSPSEGRSVQGVAFTQGSARTLLLADLETAIAVRRGAAVKLVFDSLTAPGHQAEDLSQRTAHALDEARVSLLRDFIQQAMTELGVPGVGLALYDRGQIVYEGGLGVRAIDRPEPVDQNTLFMVASNTKGMTTLLLSKLVDEGRLGWDQPVTEVYPDFRLGDDATTRSVLVRHLVCACTGLPRNDMQWIINTPKTTPASDAFALLAKTYPTSAFGDIYQYNNLMPAAAGYIAGALAYPGLELGAAYDKAMQERIFTPLGMTRSTFDYDLAMADNYASPHDFGLSSTPQRPERTFNDLAYPHRPSGGLWSSAHDMILYVANEINQGVGQDGQRHFSADNLLMRRRMSVPTGGDSYYGMGLIVRKVAGLELVHHGGSLGGYKSDIVFLPQAGVGAAILTNSDSGAYLLSPIRRRLIELLYDAEPRAADDLKTIVQQYHQGNQVVISQLVPAADHAGLLAETYDSPDLGRLSVERQGDRFVFHFVGFSSEASARPNEDGTVSFVTTSPTTFGFEFLAGQSEGRPTLSLLDGQHTYVLTAEN